MSKSKRYSKEAKNSLVSVVIPTRNSDKYLEKVLLSVKKQTYKNIETIVVDCFSSDETLRIAKKHKARVIHFFKLGDYRSAQKNLGAKEAKGEMVLFLDSDAELTPKITEECAELIKEGNSMVIIPEKHVGSGFWTKAKALERQCYLGDDTIECPWFFDKKDFLNVGGYSESMVSGEDWDLFNRMRQKNLKYSRNKSFIRHNLGFLRFFPYINKKRYYGKFIKNFIVVNKSDSIKKIPFIRPAYIRNWKSLFKHPILTFGFLTMKLFESIFMLFGILVPPKLDYSELVYTVVLRKGSVDFKKFSTEEWKNLLINASHNRVLSEFVKNSKDHAELSNKQLLDLKKIRATSEKELIKFRRTIKFLESTLGKEGVDYLIVKTFKYLDYVTFDVDVLVPYDAFKTAQDALKKGGCIVSPHPRQQGLHQRNCRKEGLNNIDLHRKFYWQGLEHIDLDFVWENRVVREINGIKCPCPSLEVDFLLHNKQLVYERYYITILDFLAVKYARENGNLDFKRIQRQVKKFGWGSSYNILLGYLDELDSKPSSFPFIYPYKEVLKQFLEIIVNQKKVPFFDLAYYHFTFLRYYLTNKSQIPYYLHWFDFSLLND